MKNWDSGPVLILALILFCTVLVVGVTTGCMWDRYQTRLERIESFQKGYELGTVPGYPAPVWRKAGER